jgi:DNA-binding response OmpR family regulator
MVDVIVVEDDPSLAAFYEVSLRSFGLLVRCAGSHAEAHLAIAERLPEVIVLDLGLPDGHGLDLIHAIRTRGGPAVGVIAVSGTEEGRADLAWADAYLRKPVDVDQLADVVRELAAVVREARTSAVG